MLSMSQHVRLWADFSMPQVESAPLQSWGNGTGKLRRKLGDFHLCLFVLGTLTRRSRKSPGWDAYALTSGASFLACRLGPWM